MSITRFLDTILVLAALVGVWQIAHEAVGSTGLAAPSTAAVKAAQLLGSDWFWPHVGATVLALSYALLIVVAGGLSLGLALGAHRLSGEVTEPILVSLYSLPKITLYPLLLLTFGLGLDAKVAFGALHGIIPVTIFTMNAVKNIDPIYLKAARALNLTSWQTARSVLLPAALPEIASALRIGFSLTLLGVLLGEMFASQRGLGFLIVNAISLNETDTLMAVAVMLAGAALFVGGTLLYIDHRLHRRV